MAATAACVRQRGDQRRERGDRLSRTENKRTLDEEVDDQPEDRATSHELADAHGIIPANSETRTVP